LCDYKEIEKESMKLVSILLVFIGVATAQVFDRHEFGGWKNLSNGCTVRTYVLSKQSLNHVSCKNLANGIWKDPYTGDTIRSAKNMDIDHVVPLENAFVSGGYAWTTEQKQFYSNDTARSHLLAVSAHENRSKGDKGPDKYLPPKVEFRKEYCRIWYREKSIYQLSATKNEIMILVYWLGSEYHNDLKVTK
jgi:5-methylcytosine-specific restriction endonuclease McrA